MKRFALLVSLLFVSACMSEKQPVGPDVEDSRLSGESIALPPTGPSHSTMENLVSEPDVNRIIQRISDRESRAAAPARLYPRVIVHPRGAMAGSHGAPVVDDFHDALSLVQPGGTVLVADGRYELEEMVNIDRPVTIEALNGTPVIQDAPGFASFIVSQVPQGRVTLRGLAIENPDGWASVIGVVEYDELLVEAVSFHLADGTRGMFVGGPTAGAGSTTVRDSDFSGGVLGILASGNLRLDVEGSSFAGHGTLALQYQLGASGEVRNSAFSDCGDWRCLGAIIDTDVDAVGNTFGETRTDLPPFLHSIIIYATDATGTFADNEIDGCGRGQCVTVINRADVDILRNDITAYADHGTRIVVVGSDGTVGQVPDFASRAPDLTIEDNVITGVGGSADINPGDPGAYAIEIAGILIENAAVARASRNRIENAATGIQLFNGDLILDGPDPGNDGGILESGSDNVITMVHRGIGVFGSSVANLNSSDVTDYVESIVEGDNDEPSDLTCNWWGTVAGPQNAAVSNPLVDFTPWATSSMAGTSTTSCSGGI